MRKVYLQCLWVACLATLLAAHVNAVAGEKILYQFPGGNHGNEPTNGLVFDASGNAYGTTYWGGDYGWGTVYELRRTKNSWRQTVIYSFRGANDGYNPEGNLLIDSQGNLYGTTPSGGTGDVSGGGGTVFEMQKSNSSWTHLILYNFCSLSQCGDGMAPDGLIFDKSGNLYGTTFEGGNPCYDYGCGVVYRLSPANGQWKETILYEFNDNGDGYYPNPGIAFGKSGELYGTTCCGGGYGYGIVFRLDPGKKRWSETPLYAFDGSLNNYGPNGYLTLDAAGHIFGTLRGNNSGGCGTYQCGSVFKLYRSKGQWVETNVFIFNQVDGNNPNPGLIPDNAGNYYGTTSYGGLLNDGLVFKLIPGKTWQVQLLYQFSGQGANLIPNPGLAFGPKGDLYGTAPGTYNSQYYGEVFEVSSGAAQAASKSASTRIPKEN